MLVLPIILNSALYDKGLLLVFPQFIIDQYLKKKIRKKILEKLITRNKFKKKKNKEYAIYLLLIVKFNRQSF